MVPRRVGTGWTRGSSRRWFARCDTCHRWRLWAEYFEVYPDLGKGGWWWECERCMIATATEWGEGYHKAFLLSLAEELDEQSKKCERKNG